MELTQQSWSKVTKSIYTAVLVYAVGNVVVGVLSPIATMISTGGNIMSLAKSGTLDASPGFLDITITILQVAVLAGYVLYLKGLLDFKKILDPNNAAAVSKIFNGTILNIAGILVAFIPVMGLFGGIIIIIGFIITLLGFNALKNSPTFPTKGRKGASKLFLAMIIGVIGGILGLIPLIGWVISIIAAVTVFFMTLMGWADIKNANVEELA